MSTELDVAYDPTWYTLHMQHARQHPPVQTQAQTRPPTSFSNRISSHGPSVSKTVNSAELRDEDLGVYEDDTEDVSASLEAFMQAPYVSASLEAFMQAPYV